MVLQELGQKIKDALNKLNKTDEVNQQLFTEMLNSLSLALIKSDVNLKLVKELQNKIRNQFKEIEEQIGNKKLLIQKRSSNKKTEPNKWDLSGAGHIDINETPEQAAPETQEPAAE